MVAFFAVWAAAAVTADAADVLALERTWTGVRDSSEQVVMSLDRDALPFPQTGERRVRTVVSAVSLRWLGEHVLYLEEFLEDEPQEPRRQILMRLESVGEGRVLAHLYTLTEPQRWKHLGYRPSLAAQLRATDVQAASGCDLTLARAKDQFHGGTLGRRCLDVHAGIERYLDVQLVISEKQYWYRRRVLRQSDGELEQEVIGFNRFEPNEARLYACRVAWSATGKKRDLHALTTLDLYEAGGQAHFNTPDGRTLLLTLHGRDWAFAVDRDALLLSVQEGEGDGPLATAWAQMDAQQIALELGWLEVRCGAMAPESDELAQ
jgi:hypothetical protein